MKRIVFFLLVVSLLAGVYFQETRSNKALIDRNIEALSRDEGKNDGALYYNEQYHLICCGPGNVRDCDNPDYVKCNF